jgi:predicted membrane protein
MSMNPRAKAGCQVLVLLAVLVGLVLLYKPAFEFAEVAARELRYFWWLILLVALAIWLIWGIGRKPKP